VILGPGRLVAIGGGRSLYLHCEGTGSPTVILEAGFGGDSNNWSEVQGPLSRVTRTCAYDRAGLGNSLPIPGVHDAATEIAELKRLLDRAGIASPYVLVGHSYGGLLMRLFAHAHPDQTAGIVLVDAMGRYQDQRLETLWRAQPAKVHHRTHEPAGNTLNQGVDLYAGEALAAKIRTLGRTPLVVITRGRLGRLRRPASACDHAGCSSSPVDDHAERTGSALKRPRARHRASQRTLRANLRQRTTRRRYHRRARRGPRRPLPHTPARLPARIPLRWRAMPQMNRSHRRVSLDQIRQRFARL
jgi:pimeloyl-ACP methyl ester carboxylesterase